MKELTIEEKAKAYDEAIERAKKMIKDMTNIGGVAKVDDIQHIFPELKESDDERIRKNFIKLVKMSSEVGGFALHKWEADEMLAWLEKQGEQKPAEDRYMEGYLSGINDMSKTLKPTSWSEEDERISSNINLYIRKAGDYPHFGKENIKEARNWMNALKDRVQPKPRKEWSEEDEKVLHAIRNALNYEKPRNYLKSRDFEFTDILDWLKSLKERYTWKPSEYELKVLKLAAEKDGACLMGLYQQLKKLRGE